MNITAIRDALAADIRTVLPRTSATTPDQVNPPCAFVDAYTVAFDDTFDDGLTITFPVVVLTLNADSRSGQEHLDVLLPDVRDAVTPTLGGIVSSARVVEVQAVGGTYEIAGGQYIGATLIVEVLDG